MRTHWIGNRRHLQDPMRILQINEILILPGNAKPTFCSIQFSLFYPEFYTISKDATKYLCQREHLVSCKQNKMARAKPNKTV